MNRELYIHTLRMLREQYEIARMDTVVETIDAALAEFERPTDSDCISRQAVIDAVENIDCSDGVGISTLKFEAIDDAVTAIEALPSEEPQRMRAKWIVTTSLQEGQITWRDYKCSNCSHHRGKPMNFCEVCGAIMES